MPTKWYVLAAAFFVLWVCFIYWVAWAVTWDAGLVGFVGTMFTFLPTVIDVFRKYYLGKYQARPPSNRKQEAFNSWVEERVGNAISGYSAFNAVLYLLGISGIALGFARQYFSV